ncbi:MAG: flagellin lysine-N-methylase [Ruminococcus sp.]|nr:flagellin lysine-N-methylase [Ruminococcus sp.]
MHIYPDYYEKFRCIASKCKHNCCIGWEIDIDNTTLKYYNCVEGDFSKRLKDNIELDDTPHFKLLSNERCPFLNDKNLCDIITTLGEDMLCDICSQHPRFHNELPQRIESGLGLCCEEACRIIISQKEKCTLISNGDITTDDEIILLRDKVIDVLQNRDKHIAQRIDDMLSLCSTTGNEYSISELCDILLSLEQLDNKWGKLIKELKESTNTIDTNAFDTYMADRQSEYEQFCVYLVYRHFANSPDLFEAQLRACFVKLAYNLVRALGAMIYSKSGSFDLSEQLELIRLFSSEIEYSDENLYTLFDIA